MHRAANGFIADGGRSLAARSGTERDQLLFFRGDLGGHGGNPRCDVQGNGLNSMQVAVQQVAGADLQPADFNRLSDLDDVDVGVGHGDAAGK